MWYPVSYYIFNSTNLMSQEIMKLNTIWYDAF